MLVEATLTIEDPEFVTRACRGLRPGLVRATDVEEIRAQCEADEAICFSCDDGDGMFVVALEPGPEGLELFVWLAVAFRHGAFDRQDAVLDAIGRDLGARTVAFETGRRGWARKLGPEWQRRGTRGFVRSIR